LEDTVGSFTADEHELRSLVCRGLIDAYPDRLLDVSLREINRLADADWLEITVRDGLVLYKEPIARSAITHRRLRRLRDELVGAFIAKLGRPSAHQRQSA
jgi:hypothetical protein